VFQLDPRVQHREADRCSMEQFIDWKVFFDALSDFMLKSVGGTPRSQVRR